MGRPANPHRLIERIRNRSERRVERWRRELADRIIDERDRRRERIDRVRASLRSSAVSSRGVEFIAEHEGFVAHAYKPVSSERYYTIGFGHYGPDVRPNQTITREAALRLLAQDVRWAGETVAKAVDVRLRQHEFDALASFAFNVGAGAFSDSTLVRRLNAGDRAGAAAEFGRWVNGAGGPLAGLVARRADERRLFLSGTY